MLVSIKDSIQMNVGTLGKKSLRGKIRIFWKNHGPSIMLRSAQHPVMSNGEEELLFSQDYWAALRW